MKTVRVVAAVIKAENENGQPIIFATQRGYGEYKDGWEFPGGKIEEGETPPQALKREIMEELDTEISVGELIDTIEYDYPTFHLSMDCFWSEIVKGDLVLKEHEAARWLTKEQLKDVDWLPADITLIEKIQTEINMNYMVKKILEADYGCEERPAGYIPQVLVILEDEAGNQIEREVPDVDLYKSDINEGDLVYFDEEGQIHKGE